MSAVTMNKRRIYVASSWRNQYQDVVVNLLRGVGHEVYDFKNPPTASGFSWREIEPNWSEWDTNQYRKLLTSHPRCAEGFKSDKDALDWADTGVLLLPCGRSAHLEAGYLSGQRKPVIVQIPTPEKIEPELMYLLCTRIVISMHELLEAVESLPVGKAR